MQEELIQMISREMGRGDFVLSSEERDFFDELVWRYPKRSDWGLPPEEGEFLFTIAAILEPEVVIEIGTCGGFSTAFLLGGMRGSWERRGSNSIALQAFDVEEMCPPMPEMPIGFAVKEMVTEMLGAVRIHTGKTSADVPSMCPPGAARLAFLDANHNHPWPTMDLIHVLPCLMQDAWIILHDINLPKYKYSTGDSHPLNHGAQWLYRLWPGKKFSNGGKYNNLGAIQMIEDKEKLLETVEKLLRLPLELHFPEEEIKKAAIEIRSFCLQSEKNQ